MKIINLIENTEGMQGCVFAHGLSFYAETAKHKLLLDLGPSADTIKNASSLGVDLTAVDTVILSHGHYDHSGGIIPFTKVNDRALIYMQESATKDYYADDGMEASERFRYIGIDKEIAGLPQVRFLSGGATIDDELEIFTIRKRSHDLPFTNKRLLVYYEDKYLQDCPIICSLPEEHGRLVSEKSVRWAIDDIVIKIAERIGHVPMTKNETMEYVNQLPTIVPVEVERSKT